MQKPVYALPCRNAYPGIYQIVAKLGRSVRHRTAERINPSSKTPPHPRPGEQTYLQLIVKHIDCASQLIPRPHALRYRTLVKMPSVRVIRCAN